MKSYVNFCARVSWDPCILATCVCRSLRPGSTAGKISGSVASRADNLFARFARRCFFSRTPIFSPFHNAEPAPRLCLSIYPHQSLLWQNGRRGGVGGQFPRNVSVSYGGWGERKRKRAGFLRSSREPRGAPFPSSHCLPRACYYFYWDTEPAEASAEKRAVILSYASNFSRSVANKDA